MNSENYRQLLNSEFNNKEMTQDDFNNTLIHFAELYHKEKDNGITDNWSNRFKTFKKCLGLNNDDAGKITGNTGDSIKNATQPNNEFPRNLKLAIVVFESMRLDSKNNIRRYIDGL